MRHLQTCIVWGLGSRVIATQGQDGAHGWRTCRGAPAPIFRSWHGTIMPERTRGRDWPRGSSAGRGSVDNLDNFTLAACAWSRRRDKPAPTGGALAEARRTPSSDHGTARSRRRGRTVAVGRAAAAAADVRWNPPPWLRAPARAAGRQRPRRHLASAPHRSRHPS
jgi:hypothetical protein